MFSYRHCRPEDCETWIALNREFMDFEVADADLWNDPRKISDEAFGAIFAEALKRPEMIDLILLEEDGAPVGFANLMTIYSVWAQGLALILDDLYIREERRGKGYGKKALELIEELARAKGCKRIQFQSELSNPGARAFYQAIGYAPTDMNFYVKYI